MPKVIGYGEDALTYWALTTRLEEILENINKVLGVNVLTKDVSAILYRPSLGRGQSCYGEFDAILIAKKKHKVFLIESKWHESKEIKKKDKIIKLKKEQLIRHQKMRDFIHGTPCPKKGSKLSRNLAKILKLTEKGKHIDVVNVIILFWREQDNIKGHDWKNLRWKSDFPVIEIKPMDNDFFNMTSY